MFSMKVPDRQEAQRIHGHSEAEMRIMRHARQPGVTAGHRERLGLRCHNAEKVSDMVGGGTTEEDG